MLNFDWLAFLGHWEQERCGVVLQSGEVIELTNHHEDPDYNFRILNEDVAPYDGEIAGIWHTHVNHDYNLSMNDYECFLSHPDLDHYIISKVGVASYRVIDRYVINQSRRVFDA